MARILLVKTSSLGDVVHNLPVASDIAHALPGAEIDWVVEESIVALPALHRSVRRAIPVAVRRWRAAAWRSSTWCEVRAFIERLRAVRYDAIIDTQGLFKSAFITRAGRGVRYGLGWRASREPLFPFYDRTFHIPRDVHAVERNRMLAAKALGYEPRAAIEYHIRADAKPALVPAAPYVVLLHATSARSKLWPEAHWIALGSALAGQSLVSALPWGSEEERARSERIAAGVPGAIVPPRMTISELGALLAGACYAIGVDTGLTHFAGALGVPTIGIYVATDPAATGLHGCARAVNVGGRGEIPAVATVLRTLPRLAQ